MNTEEPKPNRLSSPSQDKRRRGTGNQEKILINLKGQDVVKSKYHEVLKKCNTKVYGRAITATDIFSSALLKLSPNDITLLQKASITTDLDLLKYEWTRDVSKQKENIDFNAWLIKKLKIKTTP